MAGLALGRPRAGDELELVAIFCPEGEVIFVQASNGFSVDDMPVNTRHRSSAANLSQNGYGSCWLDVDVVNQHHNSSKSSNNYCAYHINRDASRRVLYSDVIRKVFFTTFARGVSRDQTRFFFMAIFLIHKTRKKKRKKH